MRAAIYARVSTERQERQQTIDSQLAALRAWAEASGHELNDHHVFRDDGYSGARLDRPGLDALRDAVRDGGEYVLTGVKQFISGAGSTDVYIVMARTGEPGPAGITAFIVPADAAGLSVS